MCSSRGSDSKQVVSTVVLEAPDNTGPSEASIVRADHSSAANKTSGDGPRVDVAEVSREAVISSSTAGVSELPQTASTSGGVSVAYGIHRCLPAQVRIAAVVNTRCERRIRRTYRCSASVWRTFASPGVHGTTHEGTERCPCVNKHHILVVWMHRKPGGM